MIGPGSAAGWLAHRLRACASGPRRILASRLPAARPPSCFPVGRRPCRERTSGWATGAPLVSPREVAAWRPLEHAREWPGRDRGFQPLPADDDACSSSSRGAAAQPRASRRGNSHRTHLRPPAGRDGADEPTSPPPGEKKNSPPPSRDDVPAAPARALVQLAPSSGCGNRVRNLLFLFYFFPRKPASAPAHALRAEGHVRAQSGSVRHLSPFRLLSGVQACRNVGKKM